MENFFKGLATITAIMVIAILAICCFKSDIKQCVSSLKHAETEVQEDQPTSCVELISEQYSNSRDVVITHQQVSWAFDNIAQFTALPESVVENVANLLLRSQEVITIPTIVAEYNNNKQFYDNIIPGGIPEDPATVTDPDPVATNTTTSVDTSKLPTNTTTNNVAPADPDPVAEPKKNDSSDSITKTE